MLVRQDGSSESHRGLPSPLHLTSPPRAWRSLLGPSPPLRELSPGLSHPPCPHPGHPRTATEVDRHLGDNLEGPPDLQVGCTEEDQLAAQASFAGEREIPRRTPALTNEHVEDRSTRPQAHVCCPPRRPFHPHRHPHDCPLLHAHTLKGKSWGSSHGGSGQGHRQSHTSAQPSKESPASGGTGHNNPALLPLKPLVFPPPAQSLTISDMGKCS